MAAVAVALFFAYPDRLGSDPTFMSPHENVRYHLARQWVQTGRPTYRVPGIESLPGEVAPASTPRDAALLGDRVVPKDFPYALGMVAALLAVDPRLPMLLSIVSGVGVLLVAGLLAWELSRSRAAALLAAALVASSTAFYAATAGLLETGATTALAVLAATLALCRGRRIGIGSGQAARLDLLGGAGYGLAVGLHHGVVLLVAGLLAAFALPRFGGRPRRWLALGAGLVGALLPVFVYDLWLFGSPLTTGYGVGERFFNEHFAQHTAGLFDLRPALVARQLRLYLVRPEVLLPIIAAAVAGSWSKQRTAAGALGVGLLLGGPAYLAFMAARPLWGMDEFRVNASLLRYALPLLALVAVLAASTVTRLAPRRWRVLAWSGACLSVLLGLAVTFLLHTGPLQIRAETVTGVRSRHAVLAATPPGAVVLTARGDKFLWPDRSTLTVAYLVRGGGRVGDERPVYTAVPSPALLADVLARLVERGHPTYVWNDGWLDPADPTLDRLIRARGIARHDTVVSGLSRYAREPPAASR
jgi:4-amino-4-deoxy-L-arabinose transferase-like glycosyltransferase